MKITQRLRTQAQPVWSRIMELPFVVELYDGSLPMDKFKAYILQDYTYLTDAIRNFSLIASRVDSVVVMKEIVEIAHLEATGEFKGYEEYLGRLGYDLQDAAATEPLPVNVSYRSFLLAISATRTTAEALTAVLPCFWSYHEIALFHRDALSRNENLTYRDWASVYVSDDYVKLLNKLKDLVDNLAGQVPYERLKDVFLTASRYEYLYWDSVYTSASWPV
ncbi:MAG TPA: TenA family protein [Deltaproteobacteria bacterium]|mgnify:CR=1 FL=1|nr:TenA family protein [Deltaproteobacteria bacterium]HPJ93376.1 TenA family protein [Deltaproteobacteria bacterium]